MLEVNEFKRQNKRMEGKERLFKKADQSKGRIFHLSNKKKHKTKQKKGVCYGKFNREKLKRGRERKKSEKKSWEVFFYVSNNKTKQNRKRKCACDEDDFEREINKRK